MIRNVCAVAAIIFISTSQAICGEASTKPSSSTPSWLDSLSIDGFLLGGVAINFARPFNKINFGHLETDRANWPQFNQAILNVKRPLDQKATGLDFGLGFIGMLGTDARYTQFLGQTEYLIHDRTQLSIVEANLQVHLPILTKGGVDVTVGQFMSYNGFEKLTSKDNVFYTRSYSSNFGPFVDTGIMSIVHATDWLDLYAGIVSGVDTSIGWPGDNNNSPSIHAGFGLNLLDGDLSILAITHSGPENPNVKDPLLVGWPDGVIGGVPAACACNPNNAWRLFNNLTATWNVTENLSFTSDISYFRESGWSPYRFSDPLLTRLTPFRTASASMLLSSRNILAAPTHMGSPNMRRTRSTIRSNSARASNFGATPRISSPPPIRATSTASTPNTAFLLHRSLCSRRGKGRAILQLRPASLFRKD